MTSSGWTRQRRCEYCQTTVQESLSATLYANFKNEDIWKTYEQENKNLLPGERINKDRASFEAARVKSPPAREYWGWTSWALVVATFLFAVTSDVGGLVAQTQLLLIWFLGFVDETPGWAALSGIVSFLAALLLGAYRQMCRFMLANTFALPMVDESGQAVVSYLGTYIPSWRSPIYRVLTNLIVTVASVWAAGMATAWIYPPTPTTLSTSFVWVFLFLLGLRLGLSAVLLRIAILRGLLDDG